MKYVLINHNYTPTWILERGITDYLIYDRSDSEEYLKDFDQSKIIRTENRGNIDYDKLTYLIDNYDTLPEIFVWGKTNLFKFITPEEFDKALENPDFKPLLTQSHKTYSDRMGVVCYYKDEMYYERNDSWYLHELGGKYVHSFSEWAALFNLPNLNYIPFPPGGNFILTRERVHRYSRDIYEKMRSTLDYTMLPAEAHCCERSYFLLWQ